VNKYTIIANNIINKKQKKIGTVTVDTDKYRLVGIPSSGREPPDVGLTRIH